MFYLENLDGDFFPFVAEYSVEEDIKGNTIISSEILQNDSNKEFLKYITGFWKLNDGPNEYTIIYVDSKTIGSHLVKTIKAIPTWIDVLSSNRDHYIYKDNYYELQQLLNYIFEYTGYTCTVEGKFWQKWVSGFGRGSTRLDMLKYVLERFDVEIEFSKYSGVVKRRIGQEKDVFLHYRLNLSNLSKSVDCQDFYTKARGYGKYEESSSDSANEDYQHAEIDEEYISPFAKIVGKREAPPIKDGTVIFVDTMKGMLKELVDNSIVVQVEANIRHIEPMRNTIIENRPEVIEIGDVVKLNDDVARIYNRIRAIKKTTKYDHKGNVLDTDFVFSTVGMESF